MDHRRRAEGALQQFGRHAGLPGVWKILFQDVLLGMARSEQQLTLPVPVFVDDAAIIGADTAQVDSEAASLAAFLLFLGVVMKEIKTRYAATLQLYIGLWWNSVTRTLELEPSKLAAYLEVFDAVATAHTLTLRDAPVIGGQHAALRPHFSSRVRVRFCEPLRVYARARSTLAEASCLSRFAG